MHIPVPGRCLRVLRAHVREGRIIPIPRINISGSGIEQRQCQMVLLQLLLDLQGGVVIGKQKFHSIEPGFSRCGKRSIKGTSVNIMDKLAAKRGIALTP